MLSKSLGPVVLDIAGPDLAPEEKDILAHPQVGGLILFTRNYEDPTQLRDLIRRVREVRAEVLVCVDHEGGRVQRFREGFTRLPAMQVLGREYIEAPDRALLNARELGWLMSVELLASDIDLSFAPVLDVDDDLSDIIGDRAFSDDPEHATLLLSAFIDGMSDAGMASTGKHFPGHGGVKADSHLELPVDHRDMESLVRRDLIPFTRLFGRLDALMSAHIVFPQIDDQLVSFSPFWLKSWLRDEYHYDGIVFSDDLTMEGAAGVGGYSERAHLALDAGCDSVIVCNNAPGAIEVLESLEASTVQRDVRSLATLARRKSWDPLTLPDVERWQKARAMAQHQLNSSS